MWLRFVCVTSVSNLAPPKELQEGQRVMLVFQCEYSMFMEVITVVIITHRQSRNTILPVLCYTAQKKPVC